MRFVSATHRDLPRMIREGQFREDLWYRIAPLVVPVPPLRDHRHDIPALVEHFLGRAVDRETLAPLLRHTWPGNVRELRNRVDHYAAFGTFDPEATVASLAPEEPCVPPELPTVAPLLGEPLSAARGRVVEAFERAYILAMVTRFGDDVTAISVAAGVDKSLVYRLLRRHVRSRRTTRER